MSIFVVNARLDLKMLFKNLVLSLGTGILASLIASNATAQYMQMSKPYFAPPSFVFPLVWTILYLFMGIAAYIAEINGCRQILKLYRLHLVVNFLWPILFFVANAPFAALIDLLVLIVLVLVLTIGFGKCKAITLFFMLPYLLWCLFALWLNLNLL